MKTQQEKQKMAKEAITRLNRAILSFFSRLISIPVLVTWFITGLLIFHAMAEFSSKQYASPVWDHLYYLWDKALPVMIFILLYNLAPEMYRKVLVPVFYYSLIAFLWENVSWVLGINWNNNAVITILFLTLLSIIVILTIKNQQWTQKF